MKIQLVIGILLIFLLLIFIVALPKSKGIPEKYLNEFGYVDIAEKYLNLKNKTIEQFNGNQYNYPEKLAIINHNCDSIEHPEWAIIKCRNLLSKELLNE